MIQQIVFIILAALTIGSALGVIVVRHTVYAALFLVLTFVASAGLWLLLEAEFLALVLVLVYVGAVMVLFLFIVMMLDTDTQSLRQGLVRYAPLGVVVALIVFAEIGYVVYSREMGVSFGTPLPRAGDFSNTRELGQAIYTAYGFPFEIAGVILLVGIVAAIMLTLRRRQGVRHQNIAKQVRVNAKRGRLRIVHMPSESRTGEKNP
ncbi:MAG: NADH-quinone oxidoreductase subunit J [Gammaproteobacteria bacterium]|nr:NADH-quinone oxidoreductase subunit J [Gammaproteobacteria bacterium]MBU6508641.1 NADH-quinone oxidoreductase subunit J [Gammaproteobacteria bacterium]MDE1983004.1 NADH-quinone oxidoreductase subunit J [Gammaproteobacteria bacterium]MDE2460344.1 NADH-quinone oxidoreductase subunit J [Gammaproteobacteria bacterium]